MARWILENPDPSPRLAHTIIAGWWPTTYYYVGTIEYLGASGDSPLQQLTRSIPGANPRDEYIVEVYKCDRHGWPNPRDPYYAASYDTKDQAVTAHHEVVRLLSAGKLKLKRIPRDF